MRDPETGKPRGENRLAAESSPYLRQHGGNPVDWFPWGEEAFAKARQEDKPIFLSIGYSTCYWCHVMERESFANPDVANRMNRHVVAVKVDREERPDVDGIYMTAVMLMTGRGGWPMSVFLTPDRKPFFGATYIPRPRFLELLEGVHSAWTNRRRQVLEEAERITEAIRETSAIPETPSDSLPDPDLIRTAALRYGEMFDTVYGGFGGAPKFPQPAILELLMSRYETTNDPSDLSMVSRTLDAMSRGGIHDQIGGGFHRYSTDAQWRVPHFEKMLYDQAQLLHAYARAFRLSGNEEFRRVCEEITEYLQREMTSGSGLFYSAQDSEVDEREGQSYLWTPEELRTILDEHEYLLAARVFGFGSGPDFDGRHIPHWPTTYENSAKESGMTVPGMFRFIDTIRKKLRTVRLARPQPFLDDKFITSWNGLTIEALAFAGRTWDEKHFVRLASRAASDLLSTLRDARGNLLHVARTGNARLPAYLDDYGAAILGLVELHRVTGETRWGEEAERIGSAMVKNLRHGSGRFRYAAPSIGFLIAETRDTFDGAFPSGNSLAVRALTGLAEIGYPDYARYAADTLRCFAPMLREQPGALPYMLWGLHEYQGATVPVTVTGRSAPGISSSEEILRIEGILSPERIASGQPVEISVTLTIEKGWHIHAHPPSLDFLIPTTLDAAVEGTMSTFTPRYPPGNIITIGPEAERVAVYENRVILGGTMTFERTETEKREGRVTVSVRAQACNDAGRCLAASTIKVDLPFHYQ